MSIKDKYTPVLNLMSELETKEVKVREERGILIIRGMVNDENNRKLILDKADKVNVENGWDIDIKIKVNN
jgi:hypothetical protein